MSDRKLSEYLHAMADYWHRRALVASDPNAQSRHEEMERDALLYARNAAALEAEVKQLRARAALAEARLEALSGIHFMHVPGEWTQLMDGMPSEESGLSWPQFDGLPDLADALRAQALGCTVEELPERGRAATGPETSDGRA